MIQRERYLTSIRTYNWWVSFHWFVFTVVTCATMVLAQEEEDLLEHYASSSSTNIPSNVSNQSMGASPNHSNLNLPQKTGSLRPNPLQADVSPFNQTMPDAKSTGSHDTFYSVESPSIPEASKSQDKKPMISEASKPHGKQPMIIQAYETSSPSVPQRQQPVDASKSKISEDGFEVPASQKKKLQQKVVAAQATAYAAIAPSTRVAAPGKGKRKVIFDALNICLQKTDPYGDRNKKDWKCDRLRNAAKWFLSRGHKVEALLPSNFANANIRRMQRMIPDSERKQLLAWAEEGKITLIKDDEHDPDFDCTSYMLEKAKEQNAILVTKAMYKEHVRNVTKDRVFVGTSLISYEIGKDDEFIPTPGVYGQKLKITC